MSDVGEHKDGFQKFSPPNRELKQRCTSVQSVLEHHGAHSWPTSIITVTTHTWQTKPFGLTYHSPHPEKQAGKPRKLYHSLLVIDVCNALLFHGPLKWYGRVLPDYPFSKTVLTQYKVPKEPLKKKNWPAFKSEQLFVLVKHEYLNQANESRIENCTLNVGCALLALGSKALMSHMGMEMSTT